MNNDQLKHIVTVLHAIAVGQFAVFGYTGLTSQTGTMATNRFIFIGLFKC